MDLKDRVVIVTGASEGIGQALARLFAAQGAKLVLAARSEEKLNGLARSLGEENTLVVPTDVTQFDQVDRLVARAAEHFGGIDILVNNAGLGLYGSVEETKWENLRWLWEVNFFGAVRAIQAALPHLRRRRGAVVNISSVAGKLSLPFMGAYCATKFALNALSNSLRMELAGTGVRVLVICPGRVQTQFHSSAFRESSNLPGVFREGTGGGISSQQVARATLRALRRGKREVILPWKLRLAVGFRTLAPALADAILRRVVR